MEGRGRANNQTGTFGSEPHDLCELCWVEHIFLVGGGMRACMCVCVFETRMGEEEKYRVSIYIFENLY